MTLHLRLSAHANSGKRPWLAHITGTHERFGFARHFLRADESGLSKLGRTGDIFWDVEEAGLYEIGGSRHDDSLFALVEEEGKLVRWKVREALARTIAARLDAGVVFEEAWSV